METGLQYHSCCLCGEGNVLTLVFGGDYACMRCIRDVMIPHIRDNKIQDVTLWNGQIVTFNSESVVAESLSGEAEATHDGSKGVEEE
tara:strand:+ start:811 stop:1071 length:261 start_codon:yes stop_codon:yes gene_type:complete